MTDLKTEKILENLNSKKVGIFADDSNLFHAYKKNGWRIDFGKFRKLLGKYCDLQFINYYIAIPEKSDDVFHGTERFLRKIEKHTTIKKKKLKYTPVAGKFIKKAKPRVLPRGSVASISLASPKFLSTHSILSMKIISNF